MKKLILMLATAGFLVQANAQVIDVKSVPQPVVITFHDAYPSISNVQWMRVDNNYEAVYTSSDGDSYITYTPTGTIVETGEGISYSSFPAAANTYVKTKYKDGKITKYYKVKDSNGKVLYKGKAKDNSYLVFDSNGNFVKEVKK